MTTNPWWLKTTTNENWTYAPGIFTEEEIEKIISYGTSELYSTSVTATVFENVKDESIRKGSISWLSNDNPETRWVWEKLTHVVNTFNEKFFNYDLEYIQTLQFTTYTDDNDFYGKHCDIEYQGAGTRKLSFTIQLSDTKDYKGGDLLLHYQSTPVKAFRDKGTVIMFPSTMLHEVTPVKKGTRYSLVGWVVGPRFR